VLIRRLKIILHCKYGFIVFIGLIAIYLFTYFKINNNSIYDINDNSWEMIIKEFSYEGNLLSLELSGEEDLVGYYNIKTEEELEYLNNNIKYGSKVLVNGSLSEVDGARVFKCFDYKKYLNHKGIYYILNIEEIEINNNNISLHYVLKNFIHERIRKIDETGYIEAFILGNKDYIEEDMNSKYQMIGVSHLFALSGMHVSFLGLILRKIFGKFKFKEIMVMILLLGYGFLVGFPASIARCLIFMVLSFINKRYELNLTSIQVLLGDGGILLIILPKYFYDVGFWFSFMIVGGIILASDFVKARNKIIGSIKLSLVSFLFSLPILLYVFYNVSILGIVYNLFYIPFVTILVYPSSLLCFLCPFLSKYYIILINIMEYITKVISNISGTYFYGSINLYQVIFMYCILILSFKFKKKNGLIILGFMLLGILIRPYVDSNAYVYYLDVGQGDSILVILPYREKVILIDTGGKVTYSTEEWKVRSKSYVSDKTITLLKGLGLYSIDYLIITHGDNDHMGDAINLVENFHVKQVIFNKGEINDLEEELINTLNNRNISYYQGINSLEFSSCNFKFLETLEYDNENDNSNVIYTKIYSYKFLFMGDASTTREEDILKRYNLSNVDFLKVGHHGSDTSTSSNFINKVEPRYCFISVGENNRYGHPKQSVLDTLSNCNIYRTDLNGSIMIILNKNKYKILSMVA